MLGNAILIGIMVGVIFGAIALASDLAAKCLEWLIPIWQEVTRK